MLAIIQFCLSDKRAFMAQVPPTLTLPQWPSPTEGQYIRAFGPIKRRLQGGVSGWGADVFCDLDRLFAVAPARFTVAHTSSGSSISLREFRTQASLIRGWKNMHSKLRSPSRLWHKSFQYADPDDLTVWCFGRTALRVYCRYKRLYVDGPLVILEIGFVTDQPYSYVWDSDTLGQFVKALLYAKVRFRDAEDGRVVSLGDIGPIMARLYARASVAAEWSRDQHNERQEIGTTNPVVLIQHSAVHERFRVTAEPILYPSIGAQLARDSFQHNHYTCPIFLIGKSHDGNRSQVRQLRASLLRLHAEHQCMRGVIDALAKGRLETDRASNQFQALQMYLNRSTKMMLRSRRIVRSDGDHPPSVAASIERMCFEAFEQLNPGHVESLRRLLELVLIRKQVRLKVLDHATTVASVLQAGSVAKSHTVDPIRACGLNEELALETAEYDETIDIIRNMARVMELNREFPASVRDCG